MAFIALSFIAGCVYFFKVNAPAWLYLFSVYCACSILTELISFYMEENGHYSKEEVISGQFLVNNVFTLIESLFFSIYFYSSCRMPKTRIAIRLLAVLLLVYLAGHVIDAVFFSIMPLSNYNSPSILIEGIVLIIFSLLSLFELWDRFPGVKITRIREFWISVGILFCFCTIVPYYLAIEWWVMDYPWNSALHLINIFSVSIMHICFIKSFLCPPLPIP